MSRAFEIEHVHDGGWMSVMAADEAEAVRVYAREYVQRHRDNVTLDNEEIGPLAVCDPETAVVSTWWATASVVITWSAEQVRGVLP